MFFSGLASSLEKERVDTVVPAKSDSDVMFVYIVFRDLELIAHMCINPIRRIGLIHK